MHAEIGAELAGRLSSRKSAGMAYRVVRDGFLAQPYNLLPFLCAWSMQNQQSCGYRIGAGLSEQLETGQQPHISSVMPITIRSVVTPRHKNPTPQTFSCVIFSKSGSILHPRFVGTASRDSTGGRLFPHIYPSTSLPFSLSGLAREYLAPQSLRGALNAPFRLLHPLEDRVGTAQPQHRITL